jgi:hypothetical protein
MGTRGYARIGMPKDRCVALIERANSRIEPEAEEYLRQRSLLEPELPLLALPAT